MGKEGMVGLAALVSGWTDPSESFAQLPSQALQLDAAVFRDLAVAGSQLALLLQRYTQAYMIQVAQGAACNRAHTMEERCARWLLMTQDHALADHFKLTHEFLAYMLGTRRATVTLAAGMLQKAGLIQYRHGQVTVLDRPALETAACECYQTIREAQERVFIPEN